MPRRVNYDMRPYVRAGLASDCTVGWGGIASRLGQVPVLVVECYPGADVSAIERELAARVQPHRIIRAADFYLDPDELSRKLQPFLTDDRVFGRMNGLKIEDYFDPAALRRGASEVVDSAAKGSVMVIGTGAYLLAPQASLLVYCDMARREIELRHRRGEVGNLGLKNQGVDASRLYKCGYFVEWRAADRLKKQLLPKLDFFIDANDRLSPKLISAAALEDGLRAAVGRPFRVVPYFDPGPWGGHWMEEHLGLSREEPNHAWCFDCVPEENSLLLGFGPERVEIPAIDLVFAHPRELLGEAVYGRFGEEFPIRFDFLDTIGGGNLSLQVHPLTGYIQENFGMHYTQDESYYLLDAEDGASVYLGLRDGVDRGKMLRDLEAAQHGGAPFPAERYVNRWPAKKHDHFLIPAGTIHCSGKGGMVLEVSATPYIFTFKLWDWGRMGLDGRPRPIHINHGARNIQWDRTTQWTERHLINQISQRAEAAGWKEESTGLDTREFIETRRHWFTGTVPHETRDGVNVLNLVEGEEAVVESPVDAFEPFPVHYAETFIVPAAVGKYTIRPASRKTGKPCATVLAFVRARA